MGEKGGREGGSGIRRRGKERGREWNRKEEEKESGIRSRERGREWNEEEEVREWNKDGDGKGEMREGERTETEKGRK